MNLDPEVAEVLPALVPPRRYAVVEEALYRGGYPMLRNYNFLRRLRLKTLLCLVPNEDPIVDLQQFCTEQGIDLVHIRVEKFKGEPTLLPNDASAALDVMLNKDRLPVYVHCLDGRHITGHVIMLLRRILHWEPASIYAELLRFTRETISKEEMTFLSDFTGPYTLPASLPKWAYQALFENDKIRRHPTMRLRVPQVAAQAAVAQTGSPSRSAATVGTTTPATAGAAGSQPTANTSGSLPARNQNLAPDLVEQYVDLEEIPDIIDPTDGTITVGPELFALAVPTRLAGIRFKYRRQMVGSSNAVVVTPATTTPSVLQGTTASPSPQPNEPGSVPVTGGGPEVSVTTQQPQQPPKRRHVRRYSTSTLPGIQRAQW